LHTIFQYEFTDFFTFHFLGREEEVEASGLEEDLDAAGLKDTSDGGGQDTEEEDGNEEGKAGHYYLRLRRCHS
jgi:hypothetical protein